MILLPSSPASGSSAMFRHNPDSPQYAFVLSPQAASLEEKLCCDQNHPKNEMATKWLSAPSSNQNGSRHPFSSGFLRFNPVPPFPFHTHTWGRLSLWWSNLADPFSCSWVFLCFLSNSCPYSLFLSRVTPPEVTDFSPTKGDPHPNSLYLQQASSTPGTLLSLPRALVLTLVSLRFQQLCNS